VRQWDRQSGGAGGFFTDSLGFPTAAFALLRDLIVQRLGVFYDDSKRDLLADRVSTLVAAHGLTSFVDYYYLLKYDGDAERHWAELADTLAVPETYFWRQAEQFEALANIVAPEYAARRSAAPLRIWSAACCTGEEPLSIAIALDKAGWLGRIPVQIVGSDASAAMVARARAGVYSERSLRHLAPELRERYFSRENGRWRVDPALHQRVRWTTANLVDSAEVGPLAEADVVFCRNVLIYFSDDSIRRVVKVLSDRMPAAGYLFLGASESLVRFSTEFVLEEIGSALVYVKR
jgi:chemotaxis protein methyltransferase CheR